MGGESITRSCSVQNEGAGSVIKVGEVIMILDLHRQGLTVSAITRELGIDRKTVRKCIARGLEPPVYGPRKPRQRRIDPFVSYLRERVTAYPRLTGRRLWRELRERGYEGGYTAVTDVLREIRPAPLQALKRHLWGELLKHQQWTPLLKRLGPTRDEAHPERNQDPLRQHCPSEAICG